jgi:peptidoglycan/xylan/chitin deacetylase (PgdA/CDA1 family)
MKSMTRTTAILAFHKIGKPTNGKSPTWNYISKEVFISQLKYLHNTGWQVIDLNTFVRSLTKPEILPKRSSLLTFDDGYRSMLTTTLPLLRRFRFPAVLFVPTGLIGKSNSFDKGIEPVEAICSWKELMQLQHHGVSIQSHGVTHRHFSRLNSLAQRREIVGSKAQLESGLKKQVDVIAFPYGDDGVNFKAVGQMVKNAGYQAAFLYGGGALQFPVTNPFRLPRLAMGPDTNLRSLLG